MRPSEAIIAAVAAVATPIVIVALSVLVFLNPIWVHFDQVQNEVTVWTGYSQAEVDQVTGSILSDLVFGPPRFDVQVDGREVLDPAEQSHMRDVRSVMGSLGLLALTALLALIPAVAVAWRRPGLRSVFWRGARVGTAFLVGGVVVLGLFFLFFFDQAFLLFHDIFFAPGTFLFDPRTEKLVQLFPDNFWSDTTMALGAVMLGWAVAVFLVAGRKLRPSSAIGKTAAVGEQGA